MGKKGLFGIVWVVIFLLGVVLAKADEGPDSQIKAMGDNILENGDFEKWSKGPSEPPDGWLAGVREDKEVKSGSCSARITSEKGGGGHIFIDQHIPVGSYAGKTIILGVWVKITPGMWSTLTIMDWVGGDHQLSGSNKIEDEDWTFVTVTRKIRSDATGEIWFRLDGHVQEIGSSVYFDDAIAVVQKD